MTLPMLADFALRLSGGLAVLLLLTPWKTVPPAFFRTHCLVILGLLVLAGIFVWREGTEPVFLYATIGGALLAYVGSVGWGLGVRRIGLPVTVGIVVVTAGMLIGAAWRSDPRRWMLWVPGPLESAFLLGSTLTAMLLGHYYLTSPAMSIDPLKRFVRCMAWGLGVRTVHTGVGTILLLIAGAGTRVGASGLTSPDGSSVSLFLAMQVGDGAGRADPGDLHGLADGPDSLHAIGDGHPLHRDDARSLWGTDRDGADARHRYSLLK